jgi:hypothetical protein
MQQAAPFGPKPGSPIFRIQENIFLLCTKTYSFGNPHLYNSAQVVLWELLSETSLNDLLGFAHVGKQRIQKAA